MDARQVSKRSEWHQAMTMICVIFLMVGLNATRSFAGQSNDLSRYFLTAADMGDSNQGADAERGAATQASPTVKPNSYPCLFCSDYPKLLLKDGKHILGAPLHWQAPEWRMFALDSMIVAGSMVLLDRPVKNAAQRNSGHTSDRVSKDLQRFGAEYSFVVLGGFYGAGAALDNPKAKIVALDGLSASIIASGIITPVLKEVVGRSRPREDKGTHDFHPFSGSHSFPSGHVTQAFAVASVIAQHYESPWVEAGAYGIATLVGYARIEQNAHFLSDVLAGAMIGTAVGKSVVALNHQQNPSFALVPFVAPNVREGIAVVYRF